MHERFYYYSNTASMFLTCWTVSGEVEMQNARRFSAPSLTRPRTDDGTLAFRQQMIKIPSVTESVSLVVYSRAAGVVDTGLFALGYSPRSPYRYTLVERRVRRLGPRCRALPITRCEYYDINTQYQKPSKVYIALYSVLLISKALRYGPCVNRGSYSFTCHL